MIRRGAGNVSHPLPRPRRAGRQDRQPGARHGARGRSEAPGEQRYPDRVFELQAPARNGSIAELLTEISKCLAAGNAETFAILGQVTVRDAEGPVSKLNELEYIRGEVYANVWRTDRIARIDPQTGHVVGWIDLSGLLPPEDRLQPVDVLNGIAYDAERDRLFVTGKLWPQIFEIQLVPLSSS